MRAWSSGVSFGSSRSGSSAGSPTGSEPSGSSCAARWPCMRWALTSAIAAATPPSSSRVGRQRRRAPAAAGAGRATVPPFPLVLRLRAALEQPREARQGRDELGVAALEERAPSGGTASGFSRYSSRSSARNRHSRRRRRASLIPVLYQASAPTPACRRGFASPAIQLFRRHLGQWPWVKLPSSAGEKGPRRRRPRRDHVEQLQHHARRLAGLLEPHPVPGERVAVGVGPDLEVQLRVDEVRLAVAAQVPVHARRAQVRARQRRRPRRARRG